MMNAQLGGRKLNFCLTATCITIACWCLGLGRSFCNVLLRKKNKRRHKMTSILAGRPLRKHTVSPLSADRRTRSLTASHSSTSSLTLVLVVFHLVVLLHLAAGVAGLDVQDHTRIHSGDKIAVWEAEDSGKKHETSWSTPATRRLRQEKEQELPAQEPSSASRPVSSPVVERYKTKMEEAASYNSAQYLLEANGRGEAVVSSAAHDDSTGGQNRPRMAERRNRRTGNAAPAASLSDSAGPATGMMSHPAAKAKLKSAELVQSANSSPGRSPRTSGNTNSTRSRSSMAPYNGRGGSGPAERTGGEPNRRYTEGLQRERAGVVSAAQGVLRDARRSSRARSKTIAIAGSNIKTAGEDLNVKAVTASSEHRGLSPAANLIDGKIDTLAHTGDHTAATADDTNGGVGQKCPWFQVDLGATMTVDQVKLTADLTVWRMRRLLLKDPMLDTGGVGVDFTATASRTLCRTPATMLLMRQKSTRMETATLLPRPEVQEVSRGGGMTIRSRKGTVSVARKECRNWQRAS
ncbi:unnamed protein product [Amoebophrya sp. A120]|nr:unnamed protein product [Amoebophrya sp. A120]|eukprot:GSA120T00021870001.1